MAGDVVDLITQDHREVERLVGELSRHPDQRPRLTALLTTLLTAHCRAEEAEVYPVVGDDQVANSGALADRLVTRLAETDPRSVAYDEVLAQLDDMVGEHVRADEATVLPAIRDRLDEQGRADLGVAFLRTRGEHLAPPSPRWP